MMRNKSAKVFRKGGKRFLSFFLTALILISNMVWMPGIVYADGELAYYKLDEASGSTAADSSGSGKNATLSGGFEWNNGRGVDLDGINGFMQLPGGILSGVEDFTISTWVYFDNLKAAQKIFDFSSGSTTANYMKMALNASGTSFKIRFATRAASGTTEQAIASTGTVVTNKWTNITFVRSTVSGVSTGTIYLDGIAQGTIPNMTLSPKSIGSTSTNYIGKSAASGDPYLNAKVDEFRIYGRGLTPDEVSNLAKDTFAPTYQSVSLSADHKVLTAKFDEDLVSAMADSTALKGNIKFTADGVNYKDLDSLDTVSITGKNLVINFANALAGEGNTIKILANTLKDNLGNIKSIDVITDALDVAPPTFKNAVLSTDHKSVTLSFSEAIVNALADIASLKANVQLAADGTNFKALDVLDNVTIDDNNLIILLNNALTGKTNKIKVLANTLKDKANNIKTDETVTPPMDASGAVGKDLLAYYRFDETIGLTAADGSENGKDAALVNGPVWGTGRGNNAVVLDGVDDYVSLPANITGGLSNFTVATWVRLDSVKQGAAIFDFGTGTNSYMKLSPMDQNKVRFAITTGGKAAEQAINGTLPLIANKWTHVAVTLNGNTGKIFVDGEEKGSNSAITLNPNSLGSTSQNYIGKSMDPADPNLDGKVDGFRIFNRSLDAAEIEALAKGGGPDYTVITADMNSLDKLDIDPLFYGLMHEDPNDGGIYPEQVRNNSLEIGTSLDLWPVTVKGGAAAALIRDTTGAQQLNAVQKAAFKLDVTAYPAGAVAGISNNGWWGVSSVAGRQYDVSLYAKRSDTYAGNLTVKVENIDGTKVYGSAVISGLTADWKKYTGTLTTDTTDDNARIAVYASGTGTVWMDMISLMPPTYADRENGMRLEVGQMTAGMAPKFMRINGGCTLEGDSLAERYLWEDSIGPLEMRKVFGSRSNYFGMLELLEMCEDLGMEPIVNVSAGLSHSDGATLEQMNSIYIPEALNILEYCMGDAASVYGAKRIADGHPAPFNLKYVEIGNENATNSQYLSNYTMIKGAILNKYPNLKMIINYTNGNTEINQYITNADATIGDLHRYASYRWWQRNANTFFDNLPVNIDNLVVYEYASRRELAGKRVGNMSLYEGLLMGSFMAHMESKADIILQTCLAPFLQNVNRAIRPGNIRYDNATVFGTPAYYANKLMAVYKGDKYVPAEISNNMTEDTICPTGKFTEVDTLRASSLGFGSSSGTTFEIDDVLYTGEDGTPRLSDSFTNGTLNKSTWLHGGQGWSVNANGALSRDSSSDATRIISKPDIVIDEKYSFSAKIKRNSPTGTVAMKFDSMTADEDMSFDFTMDENNFTLEDNLEEFRTVKRVLVNETSKGGLTSGVFHDVRIDVEGCRIQCYVDGDLKIDYYNVEQRPAVALSVNEDTSKNKAYFKVINLMGNNNNIHVTVNNKPVSTTATVESFKSPSNNPADENSVNEPRKVVSVKQTGVAGFGNDFTYSLSPWSMTAISLDIAADTMPPVYVVSTLSGDHKSVTLKFNEPVVNALADIGTLKANIQVARDGINFTALDALDSVSIVEGKLVVTFNGALTGTVNKIKVLANSLKDITNHIKTDVTVTEAIDATKDTLAPVFVNAELSGDHTAITLHFDEPVLNALADLTALKANIKIAEDGTSYSPLNVLDLVSIEGGNLVITRGNVLTTKNVKIMVLANSLKDAAGNIKADQTVTNPLDASADIIPPKYMYTSLSGDHKIVNLVFNEPVTNALGSAAELKDKISFAADGVNYKPLGASDIVEIVRGSLVINFSSTLTGSTNTVKVMSNSLKDLNNNKKADDTVTEAINASGNIAETLNMDDMAAYYKFNLTHDGTEALDSSPSGKHASLMNGASLGAGKLNNALIFDGVDDYASLPAGIVSGLENFTVSAWIYVDSPTAAQKIFDFSQNSATNNFMKMAISGSAGKNRIRFGIKSGTQTEQWVMSPEGSIVLNKWTHIAFTSDGSTGKMYIDGVQQAVISAMRTSPADIGYTTTNYIGKSAAPNDPYMMGKVDEFSIYSRALSAKEISELVAPQWNNGTIITSNVSKRSLTLNWSGASDDIATASYRIYQNGSLLQSVTESIYNVTNLTPDTTYTFKVEAGDAADRWSTDGPSVTVKTLPLSSDAALGTLAFSDVNLNPAFNPGINQYSAIVENVISATTITAATRDSFAIVDPADLGAKPLVVGDNIFTIHVTAENGTKAVYTIKITRKIPNAELIPSKATYDLWGKNHEDIVVNMDLKGYKLLEIKNGSATLKVNDSYKIENNVVTIKKGYMAMQPVGTTTLTFIFSAGDNQNLTVTVINTTPPEEVKKP